MREHRTVGGAVAYRARSQLRGSWRSLLLVAVLAGVLFGAATAAAAAARRTASAYPRFTRSSNGWDALYSNYADDGTARLSRDDLRGLPGVELVHEVRYEYSSLGSGTAFLADPSGRLGVDLARARLLHGRWFDPDAPDEVVVSFALAERQRLSVGDTFELFPREELERAESPEERAYVDSLLEAVPRARMHVIGIAAIPGMFPPLLNPGVPMMLLSPAFAELPEASPNTALLVRLEEGADVDALAEAVGRLADERGAPSGLHLHRELSEDVTRSLRPQVVALGALSAVLAFAAAVVAGQAVARHVDADATSEGPLRALGLTTGGLAQVAAVQWAMVAAVAAAVVPLTAVVLSPLSPSGLARIAEPARGVRVDTVAFAIGSTVAVAVVLAVGIAATGLHPRRRLRPPLLGGLPLPPSVGVGVRRAFDRGDRAGRVPVWSTVGGVTVGIAAIAASLTVGATLRRQLDVPASYGLRWDLEVTQFTENTLATEGAHLLADDDRLSGVATGIAGPTPVSGREESVMAMDPVRGEVRPPLVRGTYPDAPDAVALGGRTLDRLGADVGERVRLDFREIGGVVADLRVVGEVLMPPQGIGGHIDEGILLSLAGIQRAVDAEDAVVDSLFLAGAPGTDLHAVVEELTERIDPDEAPSVERPTTPSDLVDLGRARAMPTLFAAAMAFAGTAALGHTLLVSARRRRRDTAVLRALGFRGGQLRAAALVQAIALGVVALAIGVPLGIVGGRLGWAALANSIGSSLTARVPLIGAVLVLPVVVLALAALLSLAAGWPAARVRPAAVLRTE